MSTTVKTTRQAWTIEGSEWRVRVEEVVAELPPRKDGRYTTRFVGSSFGHYTPASAMCWTEEDAIKRCLETLKFIKDRVDEGIEKNQARLAELESKS